MRISSGKRAYYMTRIDHVFPAGYGIDTSSLDEYLKDKENHNGYRIGLGSCYYDQDDTKEIYDLVVLTKKTPSYDADTDLNTLKDNLFNYDFSSNPGVFKSIQLNKYQ
jgi:hypothetical protein